MNNKKLSKCKTGTVVAFKIKDGSWYTGKMQMIDPPNSKYNSNDYYKFSICVIFPVTPQWMEDVADTVYYQDDVIDIKVLENYKIDDIETKEEGHNHLIELFNNNGNTFNLKYFKEYVNTYNHSIGDRCTIEDMLYGLGVAIYGKKYRYSNGYKLFITHLKEWLEK